ncbi:MAG TPA: hypothetical protein VI321_06930 [Burkholderiales bacterium]
MPQAVSAEKGATPQRSPEANVSSTVIADNDKVRVLENRFKPGAVNATPPAPYLRVVRVMKGGTLLRTYEDGSTQTVSYRTGETLINPPSIKSYTAKNVSDGELVLYIVVLKSTAESPSAGSSSMGPSGSLPHRDYDLKALENVINH